MNIVKELFESKSQPLSGSNDNSTVVMNIVKELFESKSQPNEIGHEDLAGCYEYCKRTF